MKPEPGWLVAARARLDDAEAAKRVRTSKSLPTLPRHEETTPEEMLSQEEIERILKSPALKLDVVPPTAAELEAARRALARADDAEPEETVVEPPPPRKSVAVDELARQSRVRIRQGRDKRLAGVEIREISFDRLDTIEATPDAVMERGASARLRDQLRASCAKLRTKVLEVKADHELALRRLVSGKPR